MSKNTISRRLSCILSGLAGVVGVILIFVSFSINPGPPPGASNAELVIFAQQHYATVLWGAWLQAVGPVMIVLFALALVHLADATQRLAGWMTLFGGSVLMTTSLIEITFYISAMFPDPEIMGLVSLRLISAVQHLFFIVAAPALFLPLGIVLLNSSVLPRVFGYLAILLSAGFAAMGALFMLRLTLPASVTALGAVQALWWFAASVTLIVRGARLPVTEAEI